MIRAVIFDLDGVIVHTDEFHYLAWKSVADELGAYFDEKINMRLRGVSRMESLEILLENYSGVLSPADKEQIAARKNDRYLAFLRKMTKDDVSKDARDCLKALKDRGILTAIGSSSRNAKFILRQTETERYFDAVSDGTNITRSKPDPEVFLTAAKMLNVSPEESIVVEDAVSGIEAAVAGGFISAAIGDARNHKNAAYRIDRLSDILTIPDLQ